MTRHEYIYRRLAQLSIEVEDARSQARTAWWVAVITSICTTLCTWRIYYGR